MREKVIIETNRPMGENERELQKRPKQKQGAHEKSAAPDRNH